MDFCPENVQKRVRKFDGRRSVSTKTHSGDPDGTGGFGGFLGSGRSLALKFRFYEKFPRQNHPRTTPGRPKQCFCFVFCFVFVGFGGPGGGFGAPGGGFFSTGSSSALRYFYLY